MPAKEELLSMENISKQYPGVKALDSVSFSLLPGEVHALVGENGAGKSTLIKVLMGIVDKDSGEIFIRGKRVEIQNPLDAAYHGVAAVFQELSLIPELTVAENIFLGKESDVSKGLLLNRRAMNIKTRELLERYNITELRPTDMVGRLTTAKRQLSEIMKAIAIKPGILVLDEPTSALTEAETEKLFFIIRNFKQQGIGIIYISHRMNELFIIADRLTVLRDGKAIETRHMRDLALNDIVKSMVGRNVDLFEKRKRKVFSEKTVLEVRNIRQQRTFQGISFELREGEILGIAGLVGSGRSELMNILFGIDNDYSGEILVDEKPVTIRSVQDALSHGIAMVPESRHLQGLALCHSVEDNITLPVIKRFTRARLLDKKAKRTFSDEMITEYNVKTESGAKLVNALSGGNQQKVVIAKWLATKPRILIVDELTAGIDVNSKAEIHELICRLTELGVSVIMISSEMPELLAHSDRIIVMNGCRIIASLEDASQQQIMSLILEDNNKHLESVI